MNIESAEPRGKLVWNDFVRKNYPPVGGFMQAWEWGEFQKKLGRKVNRYFVTADGRPIAAFTLIEQPLPLNMRYSYAARGPVLAEGQEDKFPETCEAIRNWALQNLNGSIFLRLEPPIANISENLPRGEFCRPGYYIQPRYNLTVPVDQEEEDILMSLHSSTRSNVRRAKKRGVTVEIDHKVSPEEYQNFKGMMRDTIERNSGHNAYPSERYFRALFDVLGGDKKDKELSLLAFYGRQDDEPAATHFVLFFGDTATYLYGAANTKNLSSKVTTYLHWAGMQAARQRGMKYYDLGGIDAERWPQLTNFKRQFKGKEFEYAGNVDVILKPAAYRAYNLARRLKK